MTVQTSPLGPRIYRVRHIAEAPAQAEFIELPDRSIWKRKGKDSWLKLQQTFR